MKRSVSSRSRWCVVSSAAAAVLLSSCVCAANVALRRRPDADTGALGPFARCEAGEKPCRDDPDFDSSRSNAWHTAAFSLPNCAYGIQEILIQDSGSSDAVAIVRCAAPAATPPTPADTTRGIPTTASGGGTTPNP